MSKLLDAINVLNELKNDLATMPGIVSPVPKQEVQSLRQVVTDTELLQTVEKLFNDGHHAQAVERAFKFVNNLVKKISGNTTDDGSSLMKAVFSAKNPKIFLNSFTTHSEQSEQLGYMEIMSGVMTGIRNPRAHEHDWEDTEETAIALLSLANHLVIRIRNGRRSTL